MIDLKNEYTVRVQIRDWLPEIMLIFTDKLPSIGTKNNKLSFSILYYLHVWITFPVEGDSKERKKERKAGVRTIVQPSNSTSVHLFQK